MTHSSAWRRRLSANETDDRFLHIRFDVCRSFFFSVSAYFTDHNNPTRLLVFIEEADRVDEICADDRISTDTNASRLANLPPRELPYGFVRQRPASRDDSDIAFQVNVTGHDSNFAFAG